MDKGEGGGGEGDRLAGGGKDECKEGEGERRNLLEGWRVRRERREKEESRRPCKKW